MAFHQEGTGAGEPPPSRITARTILAAVLVVVAVVFIFQNRDDADLDFLVFGFSAPLWLMLLLTTVVGIAIGLLLGRRQSRRKAKK
jgi:lipopolysaccharide assembly protein A